MKQFVAGIAIGLVIGASATAGAAVCAGTGYAIGWEVTKDGNELCSDPYIWASTREIECD